MNKDIINQIVKGIISEPKINELSLFAGISGTTLLLFELYSINNDLLIKQQCLKNIDQIKENIENCESLNFCNGLAGILFMFSYLENNHFIQTEKDFYDDFDEYFEYYLDYLKEHNNYDLLYGIIGIGIYYLELMHSHPDKKPILDKIINHLLSLSTDYNTTKYWKYTLEASDVVKDMDTVNLGMLHGMPSILIFFLICIKRNYVNDQIKVQIYNIINSFHQYACASEKRYTFPHYVRIHNNEIIKDKQISRLGYCYGDLAIINLYYLSADIYNENKLKQYAERMFHKISPRIFFNNEFEDPFFCHGYASLYYFINKFNKNLNIHSNEKEIIHQLKTEIERKLLNNIDWNNLRIIDGYGGVFLALLSEYKNNFLEKILLLNTL